MEGRLEGAAVRVRDASPPSLSSLSSTESLGTSGPVVPTTTTTAITAPAVAADAAPSLPSPPLQFGRVEQPPLSVQLVSSLSGVKSHPKFVPRQCSVHVTRLEILEELKSSFGYIYLMVAVQGPRLRSNAIMIPKIGLLRIDLDLVFCIQYNHNMKDPNQTARITLQKMGRKSRQLKTLAYAEISLEQVMQVPLDDTLLLMRVNKEKNQQGSSLPVAYLRVRVESQAVDFDPNELPNEDWDDNAIPEDALSSESEENESEEEDMDADFVGVSYGEASPDGEGRGIILRRKPKRFAKLRDNFRVRTAKMRSKITNKFQKSKDVGGPPTQIVDDEDGEDSDLSSDEGEPSLRFSEHHYPFQVQPDSQPAATTTTNTTTTAATTTTSSSSTATTTPTVTTATATSTATSPLISPVPIKPQSPPVGVGVNKETSPRAGESLSPRDMAWQEDVLSIDEHAGYVALVDPTLRRSRKLYEWACGGSTLLNGRTVSTSGEGVRQVVSQLMAMWEHWGDPTPMSVLVVGRDGFINEVLRPYVELLSEKPRGWDPMRFFLVPLGGRGCAVGEYLALTDPSYRDLFFSREFRDCFDKAEPLTKQEGDGIDSRIKHYLHEASCTLRLRVAEAYLTFAPSEMDSSAPLQRTIPFLSSVFVGAREVDPACKTVKREEPSSPSGATPPEKQQEYVHLQLDSWVPKKEGDGSSDKISIKHRYYSVVVSGLPGKDESAAGVRGAVPVLLCKTTLRHPKRLKNAQTTGFVMKLNASSKDTFRVSIDGLEVSGVKFVSLSPQWSTHVRSFPVAVLTDVQ